MKGEERSYGEEGGSLVGSEEVKSGWIAREGEGGVGVQREREGIARCLWRGGQV